MLTLTDNASTIIKTIAENQGGPESAGLRIAQDTPESPDLALATASAPEPGDQVVEERGARVFLEETAAATLDDKVLDAQVDEGGGVQFMLGLQPGADASS